MSPVPAISKTSSERGNARPEGSSPGKIAALALIVLGLVGAAWWITGPAPKSADDGFPKQPPPLVLPSGTQPTSALGRAAAALATADLVGARSQFVALVAEQPDDPAAQVGLALSGWRTVGPPSVERDLTQLDKEYPESALVAAHLGIVRLQLGAGRPGRQALRDAIERGRASGDATGLRMAGLADDLAHPGAFRGYVPVLIRPAEVQVVERSDLTSLLGALERNDRREAARLAKKLGGMRRSGLARVAAIVATFDKDDPARTVTRLDALASGGTLDAASSDRAELHAALAGLWAGDERESGCARLARSSAAEVAAGTRRLAGPIHAELCVAHDS